MEQGQDRRPAGTVRAQRQLGVGAVFKGRLQSAVNDVPKQLVGELTFLRRAATLFAAAFALAGAGKVLAQSVDPSVRFGYTIVWVKDVDAAVAFYKSAFDLPLKGV
jgi:hypothetical protein